MADKDGTAPAAAEFLVLQRGGGLLTESLNQRVGAHLAAWAWRLGIHPSGLTLADLVLGLGACAMVALLARPVASGTVAGWGVGVAALAVWQVAYSLDCADGQLARLTGRASAAGARLDLLADAAVSIGLAAALAATAAQHGGVPAWWVALLAGGWVVNLLTSVLQSGELAASLVTSRSPIVRVLKLPRDQSAVLTVSALAIGFAPAMTRWVIAFFAGVNAVFLAVSIGVAAARSLPARTGGS